MGKRGYKPKQPKKLPMHPGSERYQVMLFYAQPEGAKLAHKDRERYEAAANKPDYVFELSRRYGYRCACCGQRGGHLQLDHIRPVSKGGQTKLENLQLLCEICNENKGVQIIDYREG